MLCSQASVNLRNLRRGGDEPNVNNLTTIAGRVAKAPIFIDDTSDMTISMVRAKARRMVQQHGIKLFVADYTQLFKSPGARTAPTNLNRSAVVSKNLAKELRVPVILLSQLNDDGKLKGARSIGADADVILLLKKLDKDRNCPDGCDRVEVKIDKARNSENSIRIILNFHRAFTRFESVPKIEPSDVPTGQGF